MLRTITNSFVAKRGRDLLWQGARQVAAPPGVTAMDVAPCEVGEYVTPLSEKPLLAVIDDTGRCCVKP